MLNTTQRLFNYITQNEKDGRSKPDLITRRQVRRIKKKMRRETFDYRNFLEVGASAETVVTAFAEGLEAAEPLIEIDDFGPVTVPGDPEVGFATNGVAHDDTEQLEDMTVPQLKALSKDRGLKGYSALKKAELVSLLVES